MRNGLPTGKRSSTVSPDAIRAMTPEMVLDFLAMHLNGPKADGKTLRFNWVQPENGQIYALSLENSVLLYKKVSDKNAPEKNALVTELRLAKTALAAVAAGQLSLAELIAENADVISGDKDKVLEFFSLLDSFPLMFPIMTRF
ncbi:MAG: hypothetical protein LBN33_02250 [Desulfovibrio sp.]|nr:hypothetical protein [Desulfovibrio sp.]